MKHSLSVSVVPAAWRSAFSGRRRALAGGWGAGASGGTAPSAARGVLASVDADVAGRGGVASRAPGGPGVPALVRTRQVVRLVKANPVTPGSVNRIGVSCRGGAASRRIRQSYTAEQPHFFNPYWRLRLASVYQGRHALPSLGACWTRCQGRCAGLRPRSSRAGPGAGPCSGAMAERRGAGSWYRRGTWPSAPVPWMACASTRMSRHSRPPKPMRKVCKGRAWDERLTTDSANAGTPAKRPLFTVSSGQVLLRVNWLPCSMRAFLYGIVLAEFHFEACLG